MAFDLKFLQPLGGSARGGSILATNAKACWVYSSDDSAATVVTSAYFDEVRDLLNPFDSILIGSTSKNLKWTSVLTSPKSPSTSAVTLSALDLDAA